MALAHDGSVPTLLLDAGTGLRRATELLGGTAFDGSILLGHLHWDHTQGLPFFRAGDDPRARVDLYLPAQGDAAEVLARGMSPPHFPIRPDELRGTWRFHELEEGPTPMEGFDVLAREIPHKGGRTFGYRVSDATGSLAYLSDHHPVGLGPGPHGFGPYHPAARDLVSGVDLLIHDAQYTPDEFTARADFGHSTIDYAVGLAAACDVRSLLLFHHDPARTDDELDAISASLRDAPVPVAVAAEGSVIGLGRGDPREGGVTQRPDRGSA